MKPDEVAFYRAVEDHFARLRGTPFLFTPKDFGLLRGWWEDGVPLAAVVAGIGEVMARRAERGEDPVSSLSYCRHAVTRHAKRLATSHVGTGTASAVDVPEALRRYAAAVREAADRWRGEPAAAAALEALAAAVESLPVDAPPAALAATAASVEATALDAARASLGAGRRDAMEGTLAAALAESSGGAGEVPAALRRALALKAVRELFGIPRVEIEVDASQG